MIPENAGYRDCVIIYWLVFTWHGMFKGYFSRCSLNPGNRSRYILMYSFHSISKVRISVFQKDSEQVVPDLYTLWLTTSIFSFLYTHSFSISDDTASVSTTLKAHFWTLEFDLPVRVRARFSTIFLFLFLNHKDVPDHTTQVFCRLISFF
jgi:hypothetical protein